MKMSNELVSSLPAEDVYDFLLNIDQVAMCVPGAELTGSEGDTHHGRLRLKIGPIQANYGGSIKFLHQDDGARRIHLRAEGNEQSGAGSASAEVTVQVDSVPSGGSRAHIETTLDIQGKVAQFGGPVLSQVSQRLINQFARNLEAALTASGRAPAPSAATTQDRSGPSFDPISMVLGSSLRPYLPWIAAAVVPFMLGRMIGRRSRSSRPVVVLVTSAGEADLAGIVKR